MGDPLGVSCRSGEGVEALELSVDGLGELKGVQSSAQVVELGHDLGVGAGDGGTPAAAAVPPLGQGEAQGAPGSRATRKPWHYLARNPGDLVEVDTKDLHPLPGIHLKQFTAREDRKSTRLNS